MGLKRMSKPEPTPNAAHDDESAGVGRLLKVVIVTPAHATYADIRIFQKEARSLAANGYDVTLFAQAEGQLEPFREAGIHIVPLSYSTRGHLVFGLPRLFVRLLRENADVYHLHNPFSIPLVVALKTFRRKVIYDVHEDYFERIRIRAWLPKLLRAPVAHMVVGAERLVGGVVDGAIATQPEVVARLGPRAILLENAPLVDDAIVVRSEEFARQIPDEVANPDGSLRIIYAGSVSRVRGLSTMMEALGLVNESTPARLWLVGPPDDETGLDEAMNHPAWPHVDFLGRLEHQHEVFGYMQRSDVGLALFRDHGGYARISSNKLYEYLASGIPFVASAFPAWKERLASVNAGFFCEPTDAQCVARKLVFLARNPGEAHQMAERGLRFIRIEFNWDTDKAKLLSLYEDVLAGDRRTADAANG